MKNAFHKPLNYSMVGILVFTFLMLVSIKLEGQGKAIKPEGQDTTAKSKVEIKEYEYVIENVSKIQAEESVTDTLSTTSKEPLYTITITGNNVSIRMERSISELDPIWKHYNKKDLLDLNDQKFSCPYGNSGEDIFDWLRIFCINNGEYKSPTPEKVWGTIVAEALSNSECPDINSKVDMLALRNAINVTVKRSEKSSDEWDINQTWLQKLTDKLAELSSNRVKITEAKDEPKIGNIIYYTGKCFHVKRDTKLIIKILIIPNTTTFLCEKVK